MFPAQGPERQIYLDVGCSLFAPFIEVKVLYTKFIPLKICVNDRMDIYNGYIYIVQQNFATPVGLIQLESKSKPLNWKG